MSTSAAARALGISERHLRGLASKGHVRVVRLGRRCLIERGSIDALIVRRRNAVSPAERELRRRDRALLRILATVERMRRTCETVEARVWDAVENTRVRRRGRP